MQTFTIAGGHVLTPAGLQVACVSIEDGMIRAVDAEARGGRVLRADGLLVLPSIVDLHGDAFERQWMPRPQVRIPIGIALADTDRQLAANGITTAFHGITWSWEGGLRGGASARQIITAVRAHRVPHAVEHRVHLRFENHNVDDAAQVVATIEAGQVDLLAFNDHLADIARKCEHSPIKRATYAERAETGVDEFMRRLETARRRADEVDAAVRQLAAAARGRGIAMASHDDLRADDRAHYEALGAEIAEFPRSAEAIDAARRHGSAIVLGAPNVVRGGSHCGAVDAAQMVRNGCCDVLSSDYYHPALLHAPFALAHRHGVDFAEAWRLVSGGPARAARLADRGEIAPGRRADLVLVDDRADHGPRILATFVAGRAVYLADATLLMH